MRAPLLAALSLAALLLSGCARRPIQGGVASWYGPGFYGKQTASGQRYRRWRRTAAHRSLPFGTVVLVTRVDDGQHVRVVINDRGPFVEGRVIDLSKKAARRIDLLDEGVTPVKLVVVGCKKRYGGCG